MIGDELLKDEGSSGELSKTYNQSEIKNCHNRHIPPARLPQSAVNFIRNTELKSQVEYSVVIFSSEDSSRSVGATSSSSAPDAGSDLSVSGRAEDNAKISLASAVPR